AEDDGVTITAMAPQTGFVERGHVGLETRFQLDLNGRMAVPATSVAEGSFGVATRGDLAWSFRRRFLTPAVVCVGVGSSSAEWAMMKDDGPLLGTHPLILTVFFPRLSDELHAECSVNITVRQPRGAPVRLQSGSVEICIPLPSA